MSNKEIRAYSEMRQIPAKTGIQFNTGNKFPINQVLSDFLNPFPEPGQMAPADHECLAVRSIPVLFDIRMAYRAFAGAVVVAIEAFQRHQPRAVQFTQIIFQEIASEVGEFADGKKRFAAVERGRNHCERAVGGKLQHHPACIAGIDRLFCFFYGPPARTHSIVHAYFAGAGR